MPRPPANAAPILSFAVLPLSAALLAAFPVLATAQSGTAEAGKPCDTNHLAACRGPAGNELPWLRLKLDQLLSEKRPVSREATPTYARAQRIEGTLDERIVLVGNAEIRRGGSVLRGDRITYTQATDQVDGGRHPAGRLRGRDVRRLEDHRRSVRPRAGARHVARPDARGPFSGPGPRELVLPG